MSKLFLKYRQHGLQTSPWIVLGATAILLAVVLVLAIENTQRKKHYISEMLNIKGIALIRAVEAGTRTGMMGWQLGGRHVQRLLEETARLPDVLYMALVDEEGSVVAHSDPDRIGNAFRPERQLIHMGPNQKENWEIVKLKDGRRVFEVHRYFKPLAFGAGRAFSRRGMRMHRHGMGMETAEDPKEWLTAEKLKKMLIVVGMDVAPFQAAVAAEIRNTIIFSAVLLLLGFSGLISLFWMYHYRATKKSLRDTSAFADEVVTCLPVGVVATDRKGDIAFFNSAAEKITGRQAGAIKGRPVDNVMPVELGNFLKKLPQGESIVEQEIECLFDHGRRIPLSVSATRIVNEVGDFVGNILILKDLGEVRSLQEEVRRQERLAAVGGLAAGVAHEIRNPLSSIKGMATYFAGLFEEKSEPHKATDVMIQEVDRLNRVITELLEFARPTSLNRRVTQIEPLLKRSLKLIQQDAEARGVKIESWISGNLCTVLIDRDRISQCLLNLYLNAIQSMEQGGRLQVVAIDDDDGGTCIQVSDTGVGISPDNLGRIFNPYFTTKPAGTGLGLAIVHKIVTAHEGRLKVDSTPEKGTTFSLWIPCRHSLQ